MRVMTYLIACLFFASLAAADWNQFRANDGNSGFIPVRTSPAETPSWAFEVGPVNGTAPVVGPDGTIYVGNEKGVLTAVRPDGTRRWKRELKRGWRCGTPSIDSTGRIFVPCTFRGYVTDHRTGEPKRRYVQQSQLYCCTSDGQVLWHYTPPSIGLDTNETTDFFFTSLPKVFEEGGSSHVFLVESYWDNYLMQRNFLIVLNESGELVDARFLSEAAFAEVGGGGGFRRFRSVEIGPAPLPSTANKPENAIAVVNFLDEKDPIIIVSDDADAVSAFEWEDQRLSHLLWSRGPSNTVFDYFQTSPSIHYSGFIMLGRSDGKVLFLNPWTGAELNLPWPKLRSGVFATPSSFLRQIYLVTLDGDLVALDSDGSILKTVSLGAQSASSAALSANYLFVSTSDGIYTLSYEAEKIAHFSFEKGGNSSPTIGPNGAVYVLGGSTLYAFERN